MPTTYAPDGAPLSVSALLEKIAGGWTPHYLFFWGHTAKDKNAVGKHVFSQWWPAPFEAEDVRYATAEHYMMAEKARLFGDDAVLGQILGTESPADAKKLGRKVRDFDAARWDAVAFERVVAGNRAKFGQDPALRTYLLGTGAAVIVEASPVDRIWGIDMAETDPRSQDPARWDGQNLLGFALMAVRAELARTA